MNYWVCKLKPEVTKFVVGKTERYGSYKKKPSLLNRGDGLFLWASLRVVGLAAVTDPRAGETKSGRQLFQLQYLTDYVEHPPGIEELRRIPMLNEAAFLKAGPTGIIPLPVEQAEVLFGILRASNPTLSLEKLWPDLLPNEPESPTPIEVPTREPSRNPPWSRDELLLALDLYYRHNPNSISKNHSAIVELSSFLNRMGQRLGRVQNEKFRNPNGVYMKLCNFLRFDPAYSGVGLEGGGKLEEEIWNAFTNNREGLQVLAHAIIDAVQDDPTSLTVHMEEDAETEFPEGAVLYRTHRSRERNRGLVRAAKERAKSRNPFLNCEVCDFVFKKVYGDIGEDYIECHHTVPVSELKPGSKTRIEDVAMLCANCHRMVHRRRPWLRIDQIRELVQGKD